MKTFQSSFKTHRFEMGLDFALHNRKRAKQGRPQIQYNPFLDLNHSPKPYAKTDRLGIFTITDGVPAVVAAILVRYIELRHRRGGERPAA